MKISFIVLLSFFAGFLFARPCDVAAEYIPGLEEPLKKNTQEPVYDESAIKELELKIIEEKTQKKPEPAELVLEETPPEEKVILKEEPKPKEPPIVVPSRVLEASGESISESKEEGDGVLRPIEIDGDNVEFFQEENKALIEGNVSIIKGDSRLTCDRVEYYHEKKIAMAKGNVVLTHPQGEIRGDEIIFNFETMTGDFVGAKIISEPYYGKAQVVSKVDDKTVKLERGYVTTCDLDNPHYRLTAKEINVDLGDKVTANNLKMIIGKLPILWFPSYTKVLEDQKPRLMILPGHDKDWGTFLLTSWRYYFNKDFKGNIHVDLREKKDLAVGLDNYYNTQDFGSGYIKTYYMNERNITSDNFWEDRPSPTTEKERFKAEWRHRWKIDETANATWQYYKLSDSLFLKDYFEREYDRDPDPDTFFVFTKGFEKGTLTFRTDKRVNRWDSSVERLPEVGYDFMNQEILDSGFYFESQNLYSNLSYPDASPSDVRKETQRFDSDNKISYPTRIGFMEISPFVGARGTYYSQLLNPDETNNVRTIFSTGAALSAKFYKTFNAVGKYWGMEIDRLRHILTPSIQYLYVDKPSISSSEIDEYDPDIDTLDQQHKIVFALDNKLQTKRNGKTIDLVRFVVDTDFKLKEDPGQKSFNNIRTDLEFRPLDWVSFYSDSDYSAADGYLVSSNQEIHFTPKGDKWAVNLGKRYHRDEQDQLTAQFNYRINPKWRFSVYERFYLDGGNIEEQQYTITRDLHCWEADFTVNDRRNNGTEIWIVFRLKAFPDMVLDLISTSFNKREVGSQ